MFLHYSGKIGRVIQWQIIVERTIHNKPIDTATNKPSLYTHAVEPLAVSTVKVT